MLGLMVIVSFIGCYGYAFYGIKNKCIKIRMPDGERIHYDKATQARGYYVSLGFFFILPIFILVFYLVELSK
jgi:hypothetical protein